MAIETINGINEKGPTLTFMSDKKEVLFTQLEHTLFGDRFLVSWLTDRNPTMFLHWLKSSLLRLDKNHTAPRSVPKPHNYPFLDLMYPDSTLIPGYIEIQHTGFFEKIPYGLDELLSPEADSNLNVFTRRRNEVGSISVHSPFMYCFMDPEGVKERRVVVTGSENIADELVLLQGNTGANPLPENERIRGKNDKITARDLLSSFLESLPRLETVK